MSYAGQKPLGMKAYGSIGHLSTSRLGPADHMVNAGQERMVTDTGRDSKGRSVDVFVQAKLDGSCTAVARVNGELVALGRSGYLATSSKYEMHHRFAEWVHANENRFEVLREGERLCGEWLGTAHGTIYDLTDREPWVVFDLIDQQTRSGVCEFTERVGDRFVVPDVAVGPMPPVAAIAGLDHYGADEPEGCVYRCERNGRVLFLAKHVVAEKVDGRYLFDGQPILNWPVTS